MISESDLRQLYANLGANAPVQVDKPKPIKSVYRSKTEAAYAAYLDLMMHAGEVKTWNYEPLSLKLAEGVRYVPDFEVILPDGSIEWHEVKGRKGSSYWSLPVGKVKVKLAARLRPHWNFFIVWPVKRLGTWAKVEVPK